MAVFATGTTTGALVLCGVSYLVHMFGITAGYHRYFAHRSYKTSRPFQFVLACLGCSALQKGPLWWVGHHRRHHLHADTPQDLHSPRTNSFWWSHVGWILAPDHNATDWQAVRDWSRYPELRWLNRNHWIPPLLLAALCFLVGGWGGLVWGVAVSTVLSYHATFAINSLSHLVGRRRYATADDSRNNLLLALVTLGEGWHNNHHHFQSSANQGFFWWEADLSYYLIKLLGLAGVVWDIRKPPAAKLLAGEITPCPYPPAGCCRWSRRVHGRQRPDLGGPEGELVSSSQEREVEPISLRASDLNSDAEHLDRAKPAPPQGVSTCPPRFFPEGNPDVTAAESRRV